MAFKKRFLIVTIVVLATIYYISDLELYQPSINFVKDPYLLTDDDISNKESLNVGKNWRHISANETRSLSTLGKILYLDVNPPALKKSERTYKILVWKYGSTIEKRHLYHFGKTRHDPFEDCSVKNCILTYKPEDLPTSDIVLIHLHRTKGVDDLPRRNNRSSSQIWAFLTDESPYHTFLQPKVHLKDFNGIFNWSMTYRMNSDIPVPYGRAIPKTEIEEFSISKAFNSWAKRKRKDVLVAILGSNCGSKNHRWEYVRELQKHITVDTYGGCGKLKCSGHFESDCDKLNDYLFYLAFENSNCDDYLTEKLWWNAYHKNAIPIIMGPTRENLEKLLPYQSYISVDEFATPRDLAAYLLYLNNTPSELAIYFTWKLKYDISNEHGYFKSKSYHYCRVCEALNYNSRKFKVYNNLESFWSTKNCYPAWNV